MITAATERETTGLINDALINKKVAQTMGNLLKVGKFKRFVETAVAMRGETVSSYFTIYHETLWVHITVKDLEGMKDPRLEGVLQQFLYMNPDRIHDTEDFAYGRERNFKYEWLYRQDDLPTIRVRVQIAAQIKADSETCKREIIGYTDDQPRPIYKLVCADYPADQQANKEE